MVIRYYLKDQRSGSANIIITDAKGQEAARLQGKTSAGINTVVWSTRAQGAGRGRGAGGGNILDQWAPLGEYTVTLQIGETKLTQNARITKMQGWSLGPVPQIIR
ncbi:MAG: hypothetical protein LAP85_28930 [Acidobacteriia bacterium]|nr:hypothetical protein [Terriglobia bacterium]